MTVTADRPETDDYVSYYWLEDYLFGHVREAFHTHGYLTAFDFFCIVVWKSNRAKSKVAMRLTRVGDCDLDEAVKRLTSDIHNAPDHRSRLGVLWEAWGFRLPMASAILTVLYPDDFTIYDRRVCGTLDGFYDLASRTKFSELWDGYQEFVAAVKSAVAGDQSLRDKDRYLWGKSFHDQLIYDIGRGFGSDADLDDGDGP